jgi:hypothetical protein
VTGRDTRSTECIKGEISAGATLARSLSADPMSTPQMRHLADELHRMIDTDLTELDYRRGLPSTGPA